MMLSNLLQLPSLSSTINSPSPFFIWDSWTQLFIGLILGIGLLISIYSVSYFKDLSQRYKFFSIFIPFAIAMMGLVSLNNLILVFICWELTSILSYFLITFKGESVEARRGGQHSLLITSAGGLALLGGLILIGATTGTWNLTEIKAQNFDTHSLGVLISILILLGILTKSAIFPFHFWLPGAMTAPTPASAYLHSATMVKAGVYLLYRIWPSMTSIENLDWIIFALGFITFLWGAYTSLSQFDLKGILAGTTIAHLGLMISMITWPDHDLNYAVHALVLAHATYKAGLFLFSGLIEKIAGTRRVDEVSGLRLGYPYIFAIGCLLAGASLGLPGTLAYYAKSFLDLPIFWKISVTIGFLALGKAGLIVAVRPFLGRQYKSSQEKKTLSWIWISPLLLALFSWLTVPLMSLPNSHWSFGSIISSFLVAAIAITLTYFWSPHWPEKLSKTILLKFSDNFDKIWNLHLNFAKWTRETVQPPQLSSHVLTVLVTFILGIVYFGPSLNLSLFSISANIFLDIFFWISLGMTLASLSILRIKSNLISILFLGLIGYLFAVSLALMGAPDLAMTQFSVETLSLIVLLYALKNIDSSKNLGLISFFKKKIQIGISIICGIAVSAVVYIASTTHVPSRLDNFFSENSWIQAHGRNVVNVILVDFRALDTLGEITVLGIVGIGIYLLMSALSKDNKAGES